MSARIGKLEELLARVARNGSKPRAPATAAAASSPVAAASAPALAAPALDVESTELELDEPSLEEVPDSLDSDSLGTKGSERDGGAPPSVELEMDEPAESAPASLEAAEVELDEVELDEPPESGRSLVADPMQRALEAADRSGPLTPPPESGPEPAKSPSIPAHSGPTMEQLGQTITLEEGPEDELEVDEPVAEAPVSAPRSHLEMELPESNVGTYDAGLSAPPEAREELERVRLGQPASVAAHVAERPVLSTNVVDFVAAHRARAPESFLGWLDSSLEL